MPRRRASGWIGDHPVVAIDLEFMADFTADPLWHVESGSMVDLDDLPLSDETVRAVRAWAGRRDRLAYREIDEPDLPEREWADVDREGETLWLRLREELGGGYRVGRRMSEDGDRFVQWEPGGVLEPHPRLRR